jgi:hypothetical protein
LRRVVLGDLDLVEDVPQVRGVQVEPRTGRARQRVPGRHGAEDDDQEGDGHRETGCGSGAAPRAPKVTFLEIGVHVIPPWFVIGRSRRHLVGSNRYRYTSSCALQYTALAYCVLQDRCQSKQAQNNPLQSITCPRFSAGEESLEGATNYLVRFSKKMKTNLIFKPLRGISAPGESNQRCTPVRHAPGA